MSALDPYEQHRALFAAELRRVTPSVRRRRRRFLALGGASVALAGAVMAVVIIAPTTGSRLDVVADARAAIAVPPDSIVHFAATTSSNYPLRTVDLKRNKGCTSPKPAETWQATTPGSPRYRVQLPLNPCSAPVIGHRIATGSFDIAYADRTMREYSASDGFLLVHTGLPDDQSGMTPFGSDTRLTEGNSRDPVARIRSLLAQGRLTDAGTVEGPNGRTLRRLVGRYTEKRGDPKAQQNWPVSVDYRVDAKTFAPVLISTTSRASVPKDPNVPIRQTVYVHRQITEQTRFSIYESIPLTPATEGLLTVSPKPGTDITTDQWSPSPGAIPKPSSEERARAQKIIDAQIKAGIRLRSEW